MMECQVKDKAGSSYFVVYPAPESRSIDLFGFLGVRGRVELISEDLILACCHYSDIYKFFGDNAIVKHE